MSVISAGTTSDSSIKFIANSDGTLTLKTNDNGSSGGTTALTLAANQAATFASTVNATTAFSVGSSIATTGEIRLKVGQSIVYRNVGNTVDLNLVSIGSGNILTFGGNDQGHIYHNVATGQAHYKQVNGVTVTTTNSTGLAVTGAGGGAYVGQFTNSNSTSYGLYVAAGGGGSRQIAYFTDYLGNVAVSIQSTALWSAVVGSSAVFQIGSTTQGRVNGTSIGGISYYSNSSNSGTLDVGSVNAAPDQINFYTSSGFAGKISSSGTSTTYGTSSDYRLKDEITDLTGSGAFIDALRPVTGKWKADGSNFTGFIAHEFALVSPSSVSGEKDAVDADGNPIFQTMQASSPEVMAHVVAELKSLRTRVAALESK